jgi:hypothetical protein
VLSAWVSALTAAVRFVAAGPSCRDIEQAAPDAARLRLFMLLRMTVYRQRDGYKWPYRYRRSQALRRLRRLLPDWLWYRALVLPLCLNEVARLTWRNVRKFGAQTAAQTGLSPSVQFAQVLALCTANPGTFPTEYYVFGMHERGTANQAGSIANGYDVEAAIAMRQPASHLRLGSGFPSENLDLLNNKERFRELCDELGLPVSRSCAVFDGGTVTWTSGSELPRADLFVKPLYGGGGYGAARVFYSADSDSYRIEEPRVSVASPYPSAPLDRAALVRWFTEMGRTVPFVIEVRVAAHPAIAALVGSHTLPTLRVVSLLDAAGRCSILFMYLRAAVTDSPVDNVSAGGLASMVDPVTNTLGPATTSVGDTLHAHPLTGQTIAGFTMPFAAEVRAACMTAHLAVARAQPLLVPVIGWDVTVTADGPLFLEGNTLSDLSTAQKLAGAGCWANPQFSDAVLSYLAPIAGTRVPIDPGEGTAG